MILGYCSLSELPPDEVALHLILNDYLITVRKPLVGRKQFIVSMAAAGLFGNHRTEVRLDRLWFDESDIVDEPTLSVLDNPTKYKHSIFRDACNAFFPGIDLHLAVTIEDPFGWSKFRLSGVGVDGLPQEATFISRGRDAAIKQVIEKRRDGKDCVWPGVVTLTKHLL